MRPTKRIRGRALMEIRSHMLSQQPLCVACLAMSPARYTAAVEIDHIIPLHRGGPDAAHNRQPLCKSCHADKTLRDGSGMRAEQSTHGAAYPEWLEPARCELTIVCGPPGSGRTTYVAEHARPGDDVIDLDVIKAEVAGMPIYRSGSEWIGPALRERNNRLGALARRTSPAAWLIVGGDANTREWWQRLKPAQTIVLRTSEAECVKRIMADARRPEHLKRTHCAIAREWWRIELSPFQKVTESPQNGTHKQIGPDGFAI